MKWSSKLHSGSICAYYRILIYIRNAIHKGRQRLIFDSKQEKIIDEWGPQKKLHVYDPDTDIKGVLVIDNTSIGPGKGGILFANTITPTEIFRLARTMTWK